MHNVCRALPVSAVILASLIVSTAGCSSDDPDPVGQPLVDAGDGGAVDVRETGPGPGEGGTSDAPVGKERRIVVLYTSDEHSALLASAPEQDDFPAATSAGTGVLKGGVTRRATVLKKEREAAKTAGKSTLTVSAGDNNMGTLMHLAFRTSAPDWRAMFDMGYDATTLGNHEFDFGLGGLVDALSAGKTANALPPIVSSNIHFSDTDPADDKLAAHYSTDPNSSAAIKQYRIVSLSDGVRVGIVGFIGADAESVAPLRKPVMFSELGLSADDATQRDKVLPKLYAELQPLVDKLRSTEKVDLVVALSHAGLSPEVPEKSEDNLIAANVSGLDLIISGHSHLMDPKPVIVRNTKSGKDTIILNGGASGLFVGKIELVIPGDSKSPITFDAATQGAIPIDDKIIPDETMAKGMGSLIEDAEQAGAAQGKPSFLESLLTTAKGSPVTNDKTKSGDLYFYPITKLPYDMPEASMVSFLSADAQLEYLNDLIKDPQSPTEMAVQNAGVVRRLLYKGKTGILTAADLFNVIPLGSSPLDGSAGNPLVRVKVPVGVLRAMFEFTTAFGKTYESYGFYPAGATVEYDCTRAPISGKFDVVDVTKGRVMKILLDKNPKDNVEKYDEVLWDRANQPQDPNPLGGRSIVVAMSAYLAYAIADQSMPLTTLDDKPLNAASIAASIVKRQDGSEVKELEAFFHHLARLPGGQVSDAYQSSSPNATVRYKAVSSCP